jgi:hypothetical protein
VHRNAGSYHAKFLLLLSNFNKNLSALTNFSKTPRSLVHENIFKGPPVIACDKIKRQINTMLVLIYETNTMYKLQTHLTLYLLKWRIWRATNNASKWQMGFNLAFEGLKVWSYY